MKQFIQSNTKDFIRFKTELLSAEVGNDPIKKAGLIREIVASIALIPDAITRSVFVKDCSRILDIEEQTLLNELNKFRKTNYNKKQTGEVRTKTISPNEEGFVPDLTARAEEKFLSTNRQAQNTKSAKLFVYCCRMVRRCYLQEEKMKRVWKLK